MKKPLGLIAIFLLLLAALFIFTRGQKEASLTSPDGLVKLTLPPKSLPKGVKADSLKITNLPSVEGTTVYRLAPDGLALTQPAAVEIKLNTPNDSFPIISHLSDKESFLLENVTVGRDSSTAETIARLNLSHFSYLAIFSGMFHFTLDTPPVVYVGEPFTATIKGEHTREVPKFTLDSGTTVTEAIMDPWTIEGYLSFSYYYQRIMSPLKVDHLPPPTQKQGKDQSFSQKAQFTCLDPEKSLLLAYHAKLSGELKKTFSYPESQAKSLGNPGFTDIKPFSHTFTVYSDVFDCEAKPTPSPRSGPPKTDTSQSTNLAPIDVLVLSGKFFPANQFKQAGADTGCSPSHYHADYEVSDIDLSTHLTDPNPTGCGFGTVDTVPRRTEMLPKEKVEIF